MDISSITSIVVALISATGGVLGTAMAVRRGNRENEVKDALREQRQSDRLDRIDEKITELSKKVDVHNGYAEKFTCKTLSRKNWKMKLLEWSTNGMRTLANLTLSVRRLGVGNTSFAEYWGKFTVGQIIKFNEIVAEKEAK